MMIDRKPKDSHCKFAWTQRRPRGSVTNLEQFATPTQLARDVVAYGLSLLPKFGPLRFLDPALGTGSFYSALTEMSKDRQAERASGFEIDPHFSVPAKSALEKSQFQNHGG